MRLHHGLHLGYCTNIHRGETWAETLAGLRDYTLRVRDRVCPAGGYGIGLRLSALAARELAEPSALAAFKDWLAAENAYVVTINGFPYGKFHGTRVKERVYLPDWTSRERLDYTKRLFDLLAELLPEDSGMAGSVSTLPGSFKEFRVDEAGLGAAMIGHLLECADYLAALSERTGRDFHLGLEPEPLGDFETSVETVAFFERLFAAAPDAERVRRHLGVNYDTCHLAVEYESPAEAIGRLRAAGIRISKLHLSSALALVPTPAALERLRDFEEDVYLHQVIVRREGTAELTRYRDLPPALEMAASDPGGVGDEWRVHFHVPLHAEPEALFGTTRAHLLGVLDLLAADPSLCAHLEMETYTWEVLPPSLHSADVVDQLEREYRWCLGELRARGLAD